VSRFTQASDAAAKGASWKKRKAPLDFFMMTDHLELRVLERTEPRLPDLDELRDRLSTDYSFETRQAANALALERLTERYQIVFDGSWTPPFVKLAESATPLREGTQ